MPTRQERCDPQTTRALDQCSLGNGRLHVAVYVCRLYQSGAVDPLGFVYRAIARFYPAAEEAAPIDDRYAQVSNRYVIPIAFSPSFEMPLD